MADPVKMHALLMDLKRVAELKGSLPNKHDYTVYGDHSIDDVMRVWPTFNDALKAAGILGTELAKEHKAQKFKYKRTVVESFKINEIDLADMFARAGNPSSLKVVVQPDTHVKNRDHNAVRIFLDFLFWYKPHAHIILGDFLDAEGISHWPSDSMDPKRLVPEVIEARQLLKEIVLRTPDCKTRLYLSGNHEDWLRQAMVAKLPELFDGLDELGIELSIKKLLNLDEFGYDLIELNELLKVGKAYFTHGLYVGSNHAKKHLDVIKGNIYYGHLHDILSTHQPSINGFIEAVSLGCLCRLDAPFMKGKPTNWVHAFGVFEFFPDGTYSFYLPRIFGGRLSFNGMVFNT